MSGWIKVEKDLESDPRVLRMAKRISVTDVTHERISMANAVTQVVGALARLWIFADTHARDDNTLDMGSAELDEWLGVPDFCASMPEDWVRVVDEHTVELPGFQEHNGVDAKKRALVQKRVQRHRVTHRESVQRTGVTSALPDQDQTKTKKRPRPEKRGSGGERPPVTYPIGLDAAVWQRWLDYRSKIGKPLKPASLQAAIDELVKFGADQAAVVQQSVAAGWQGLFALKANGNGATQHAGHRKLTRYEELTGPDDVHLTDGPSVPAVAT